MSRHPLKNAAILSVTEGVNIVCGITVIIAVARLLDKNALGLFSFAFALGSILCIAGLHGITDLIIREVSSRAERGDDYFAHALALRGAIILAILLLLTGILRFSRFTPAQQSIIVCLVMVRMLESVIFMLCGFFRAAHEFHREAYVRISLNLLTIAGTLAILLHYRSLLALAVGQLALTLAWLGVTIGAVKIKYHYRLAKRPTAALWGGLLQNAYRFSLISLLLVLLVHLNTLLLTSLRGEASTGVYSAAYRFITALGMLGASFAAAFYPLMSQTYRADAPESVDDRVFYEGYRSLLILSVFLAGFLFYFARDLVVLVYGHQYSEAVRCLQVLAPKTIFNFLNAIGAYFLMALRKERTYIRILIAALLFSLGLNLLLIHRFDYLGASWGALLPEVFVFGLQMLVIGRVSERIRQAPVYIKLGLAAAITALGLSLAAKLNPWIVMSLAPAAYLASLMLFRVVGRDDWLLVAALLNKRK